MQRKKIGLIINPLAGVGGTVGLKGSDGYEIQKKAFEKGAIKKSSDRAKTTLEILLPEKDKVVIYAAPGEMGSDLSKSLGFTTICVGEIGSVTTADDTERIATELNEIGIDLLVFAGGDGTARNIYNSISGSLPVIGIPAGVKIHSAVYAMSPLEAGKALLSCLAENISTRMAEVMDIDEEMYRCGKLQAKLYGYLPVPIIRGAMQNPKAASHNSENDVFGICEEIKEHIEQDMYYILGAGSTVASIKKSLGFEGTLIGIDIFYNGKMIAKDVSEKELVEITSKHKCKLIITAIGGQGHIFGRGNQQISPRVIQQIGVQNILVVATASKIYSLPSQSLFVDTGDEKVNETLRGYRKVIVGWQETLVCRVL